MIPWPLLFPIVGLAFLLYFGLRILWEETAGNWKDQLDSLRSSYYGGYSNYGLFDRVSDLEGLCKDHELRLEALEKHIDTSGDLAK